MISRQENVQEERIADINMRREMKAKVEARKENLESRSSSRKPSRSLSPGSRNQARIFWKAGKCHRGEEYAFQHPSKPAAPSTKDDKRGKSKSKRKKKKKKKKTKKGDRSRSSS